MLQSIRDHTQGWIAGVIISILILSFALWGVHSYLEGGSTNPAVASVNGVEITKGQLSVAYERLRRQLQMQNNSNYEFPEQAEAKLKDQALQTLINIQVLDQASLAQNYRISMGQIDSFLENMPEFQVNGQFSIARFQKLLETTMFNANDFLELIKSSLLIDQPRLGLIFTSFALPNEITDTAALVNQERDIQFAILPNELTKQPVTIPADKIQAYYQAHQEEFKTPEQVSIDYVELTLKDLMTAVNPTDDLLKHFYTENSSIYTQPMQWKIEAVLIPLKENAGKQELDQAEVKANTIFQKAKSGTDLTSLIREFSLQKYNEKFQNWVTVDQVPAELQTAVSRLTKKGQVAEPVKVAAGFVILKVADTKDAVAQSYEQVKSKVLEAYIRQQAEEKFAELREKLANIAYEHPDSLDAVSKTLGLKIKTSELFAKDKGGKDVTANSKVRELAFSNDVLNLQNNSEVIPSGSDAAIVIRVKNHVPAALLPMTAVQNQIIEKLTAAEMEARSLKIANEIRQKLQNNETPAQIAQQYHLTWQSVGFIGRHSNKVDPAILDAAFSISKPQANKLTFDVAKVADGYAIVALHAVKNGVLGDKQDQYQVFAEQIQNTQGLIEYELYKQSVMKQAKIVIGS